MPTFRNYFYQCFFFCFPTIYFKFFLSRCNHKKM